MLSQNQRRSTLSIASLALFASVTALSQLPAQAQAGGSGKWTLKGSMSTARSGHAAVRLRDGRVLATGGIGGGTALASSELYDPATGTWSPAGDLNLARSGTAAILLPNGKVLLAGGCTGACDAPTPSAELYDPASGTWSATGSLNIARYFHSTTLLNNGEVLIAGGCNAVSCASVTGSAELYDPATETWSFTGSLSTARELHTATTLADGRVLVAGGLGASGILSATEIYDPASASWARAANMGMARAMHAATRLADGKVLVMGGQGGPFHIALLCSTESFDPMTGQWTTTKNMQKMRESHTATLLRNGKVLVAGGTTVAARDGRPVYFSIHSSELYDPKIVVWTIGPMQDARAGHTATILKDGRVLAAGGIGSDGDVAAAELYRPRDAVDTR